MLLDGITLENHSQPIFQPLEQTLVMMTVDAIRAIDTVCAVETICEAIFDRFGVTIRDTIHSLVRSPVRDSIGS